MYVFLSILALGFYHGLAVDEWAVGAMSAGHLCTC